MIQLTDITKEFGDKKLFNNFQLHITTGEKILISAPSGSGKTTLIRMLMGFEVPDAGLITIGEQTMDKHSLKTIRGQIAYVSQDTDLSYGTVEAQLNTVFSYKINRHIEAYIEKFKTYCPNFNLPTTILEEDVIKLSGGERQRVALIIALLLNRPYLILDEITSGLDHQLKKQIADYVVTLDKTIIIVSHDTIWLDYDGLRGVSL